MIDKLSGKKEQADCGYGTLWWCREDVVLERFFGWGASDRTCHPVLSVYRERRDPDDRSDVPMLVGTSGMEGPVLVRGLSEDRGPEHPTVFGRLVAPGHFSEEDFTSFHAVELVDGRRQFVKLPAPLWPNFHKPQVTPQERIYLDDFYERRILSSTPRKESNHDN